MKTQLNALAAALALGIMWGVGLFLWTFLALKWAIGVSSLELLMEWYPYYELSARGAFWGLFWGFVDGFICAYIVIWLYNFFVQKLGK